MTTTATTDKIAKLKRALTTAPASIKDKIRSKIKELNQSAKDSNVPTKKLAVSLLGSQKKVDAYSTPAFNAVLKRLSNKPEYHFLKVKNTKSKVKEDIGRHAKAVGWRFKGQHNYKKPTASDIDNDSGKPFSKRKTYYEGRSNRSDVVFPVKLEKGGNVGRYKDFELNAAGNFEATINGNKYEVIYRDDKTQLYDLFENGNKRASSKEVRKLMQMEASGPLVWNFNANSNISAGAYEIVYDDNGIYDLKKNGAKIESGNNIFELKKIAEGGGKKMEEGGNISPSFASIDAPPSMPREQYDRITAEVEQRPLFDKGRPINSVINRHVAIAKICDNHNCRASDYYAAQRHYDAAGEVIIEDEFDNEWFEEKTKMAGGGKVGGGFAGKTSPKDQKASDLFIQTSMKDKGRLKELEALNKSQLADRYTKIYGGGNHSHHDYNTLLAAVYFNKRIKHLTEDETLFAKTFSKTMAKGGRVGKVEIGSSGDAPDVDFADSYKLVLPKLKKQLKRTPTSKEIGEAMADNIGLEEKESITECIEYAASKLKGGKTPGPKANPMLGEKGLITDKRSLFKGQHGTILHDRGKQWVVEVEENGKPRKVWVSKHGFKV